MEPSCGPACDGGENRLEYHRVAFAYKAEGMCSDRVQQVPFGLDEDGGSCCWEVEQLLSVVGGVAAKEEEPGHFVEPDDAAVGEEVARLRMERSFRPEHSLVEAAVVAE